MFEFIFSFFGGMGSNHLVLLGYMVLVLNVNGIGYDTDTRIQYLLRYLWYDLWGIR